MFGFKKSLDMPSAGEALPGRDGRSRPPTSISSMAIR